MTHAYSKVKIDMVKNLFQFSCLPFGSFLDVVGDEECDL